MQLQSANSQASGLSATRVLVAPTPAQRQRTLSFLAAILALGASAGCWASPIAVGYAVTAQSASAYSYTYTLTGGPLTTGETLAIYFPYATSTQIALTAATGAGFGTQIFQPDPNLPADGEFDLISTSALPSFGTLIASFVYSGVGLPGSQSFTVYDPQFQVLQNGATTPGSMTAATAPEPASLWFLGTGVLAGSGLRLRRSKRT